LCVSNSVTLSSGGRGCNLLLLTFLTQIYFCQLLDIDIKKTNFTKKNK